jgi:putative CocE/NonD family hydrolase
LEGTSFRQLYLSGPGPRGGIGRLLWNSPATEGSFRSYTYDPGHPTPSFYAHLKRGVIEQYQEALPGRDDVLVYETDPLTEPLHLAGPVSLTLYASSSARDTDWVGTLYGVTVSGEVNVLGLTFGVLRARFRESRTSPSLLEPERVYPYTLDLSHTAVTVPAGQRLRLEVASAAFPEYSRNLNTGGNNETETSFVTAFQKIHHGQDWPSHLLLPVVNPGDTK